MCLLCGLILRDPDVAVPRYESGLINIYHMPLTRSAKPDVARKSSGFLNHQAIVCHVPLEKFPYFPVKFMKAVVWLFSPAALYDPILLWWIACLMDTDR